MPNRIDLKKYVPRHITAKLLKTKDKVLKAQERNDTSFMGKKQFNDTRFLIRNQGGQKQVTQYFPGVEAKELTTQNSLLRENVLQK